MENELDQQENQEKSPKRRARTPKVKEGFGFNSEAVEETLAPKPEPIPAPEPAPAPEPKPEPAPAPKPEPKPAPTPVRKSKVVRPSKPQGNSNRGLRQR